MKKDLQRITIGHTSGWLWWKKTTLRTYEGYGVVWRDVETGEQCDRKTEARLVEIAWQRHCEKEGCRGSS